tara:strand:- start:1138 stop:1350 length:213 start_codon:yes stop_codon:yes gene_type:complete
MNINININKKGLSDSDINDVLDVLEMIDEQDIIQLCEGSEMMFKDGLINIKIKDNKDYQPCAIVERKDRK